MNFSAPRRVSGGLGPHRATGPGCQSGVGYPVVVHTLDKTRPGVGGLLTSPTPPAPPLLQTCTRTPGHTHTCHLYTLTPSHGDIVFTCAHRGFYNTLRCPHSPARCGPGPPRVSGGPGQGPAPFQARPAPLGPLNPDFPSSDPTPDGSSRPGGAQYSSQEAKITTQWRVR